jgi:anti-sigma regulatory factor (Ser/Thr protein kinase)
LRCIYETCERLGAAESECLSLQLAVEEVCTNLIEFGYGCCGGPIAIGIARSGGDR